MQEDIWQSAVKKLPFLCGCLDFKMAVKKTVGQLADFCLCYQFKYLSLHNVRIKTTRITIIFMITIIVLPSWPAPFHHSLSLLIFCISFSSKEKGFHHQEKEHVQIMSEMLKDSSRFVWLEIVNCLNFSSRVWQYHTHPCFNDFN